MCVFGGTTSFPSLVPAYFKMLSGLTEDRMLREQWSGKLCTKTVVTQFDICYLH